MISVATRVATRIAVSAGFEHGVVACGVFLAHCRMLLCLEEKLFGASDGPRPLLEAQSAWTWEERHSTY